MGTLTGPEQPSDALRQVAVMFAELGEQLASADSASAFDALTQVAARRVPGTDAASITMYRNNRFSTVASTSDRARHADAIQYELRSGPCLDAVVDNTLYQPDDLRHDDRWPEYGTRVNRELGWTSMLSFRLFPELASVEVVAGLNLYAERAHAFDAAAVQVGLLLATHGAMAIAADVNRAQAEDLKRALGTNREIGVAVGMLMSHHRLTRDQAFDLLRVASQHQNRKLRDIAAEVAESGTLPLRAGESPAEGVRPR
jgi:ANTAR domain-containing protein/GAF domain-containing protein